MQLRCWATWILLSASNRYLTIRCYATQPDANMRSKKIICHCWYVLSPVIWCTTSYSFYACRPCWTPTLVPARYVPLLAVTILLSIPFILMSPIKADMLTDNYELGCFMCLSVNLQCHNKSVIASVKDYIQTQ